MDKYQVLYEYVYKCYIGFSFKKQICINDNKQLFFNFIVNDGFGDNLLLTKNNMDFKDNILNIKIKDYLLKEIKAVANLKSIALDLIGVETNIEIIKNGISVKTRDNFDIRIKKFILKKEDYFALQYLIVDYINEMKKCKKGL